MDSIDSVLKDSESVLNRLFDDKHFDNVVQYTYHAFSKHANVSSKKINIPIDAIFDWIQTYLNDVCYSILYESIDHENKIKVFKTVIMLNDVCNVLFLRRRIYRLFYPVHIQIRDLIEDIASSDVHQTLYDECIDYMGNRYCEQKKYKGFMSINRFKSTDEEYLIYEDI